MSGRFGVIGAWLRAGVTIAVTAVSAGAQESALGLGLDEVPLGAVELGDGFWKERARTVASSSLPALLRACDERGLVRNFALAAGTAEGEHTGNPTDDALVYMLLEAAAYSLATFPDPELSARVDTLVGAIAAAQREDGYLDTYSTVASPGRPWRNLPDGAELYVAGHLIEAAVALASAARKPELLPVARRVADLIVAAYDPERAQPGKPPEISPPAYPGIELALVRLARQTGELGYQTRAENFVDARGRRIARKLFGEYALDETPLLETKLAVGHAARAMNLYCAVADLARRTAYEDLFTNALTLFDDVQRRKCSPIGGVGIAARRDAFGALSELALHDAGGEARACAGLARWSHQMFLLSKHALHASIMERALYNSVLGGCALDGDAFLPRVPLASEGDVARKPGLEAGLDAADLCRTIASVPSRVFAREEGALFVSMYAPASTVVPAGKGELRASMETNYPWDGRVSIRFDGEWSRRLALHVLIPAWCTEGVTLGVNEPNRTVTVEHGHDSGTYLAFDLDWKPGDAFILELPVAPKRLRAPAEVAACRGRVALQRGPLVYAFEACDHEDELASLFLPPEAELASEWRPDLLGGVHVITAQGFALRRGAKGVEPQPVELTAVPYYAWGQREAGAMTVWIPESAKLCKAPASAR